MVPRSRLVVFGTIASVLLALGCKTETPTTTVIEDNGKITKASKAPAVGGAFRGTVNFAGAIPANQSTVTLVNEKLVPLTEIAKAKPDSAGKFTMRLAPTIVSFVLVEGAKAKLLGAVLPVNTKDPKEEPEIVVNVASTLAVAGIMGEFDRDRGGQHQLEDLPIPLFNKLVEAVAATNPQLDLTKDPKDHAAQFGDLLKANAAVKAAYDALFGELEARFKARNPGLPVPSPSVANTGTSPSPSPVASAGTGLASVAPSPSPSVDPNASPSPDPNASPSSDPNASPSPGASGSPAASPTPRVFPVLKHTIAAVTGNGADGASLAIGTDYNLHFCALGITNPVPATIMAIPDKSRLVVIDSFSGGFRAADFKKLLRASSSDPDVAVDDVAGVTTDGQQFYSIGRVAGTVSLIKVSVGFGTVPDFTASAIPLTGVDLPTGFQGHALHAGWLYVASPEQHRIYKVNLTNGETVRYAGDIKATSPFSGQQDPATTNYNRPSGLLVVGDTLYCSEEENHRILKFGLAEGGKVEVFAGSASFNLVSGTLADARFQRPSGLYFDSETGKILVADTTNGTIRRIDPDPDPAKSEVLHYATVDSSGGNEQPQPLRFFLGVGKVGNDTYAVDATGTIQKLTPKL